MNINIPGPMHVADLKWLESMATKMNSIVEIGSWRGRSTHALLTGCNGSVYAVDNWKGSAFKSIYLYHDARKYDIHSEFLKNVGHFKNLYVVKMDSMDALSYFANNSVDMIFIDAEHSYEYVKDDIGYWLPKAKKVICGHDIKLPSVAKAVKDVIGKCEYVGRNIWSKRI